MQPVEPLEKYLTWKEYFIIWILIIIFFSGENYLAKIIYNYFVVSNFGN